MADEKNNSMVGFGIAAIVLAVFAAVVIFAWDTGDKTKENSSTKTTCNVTVPDGTAEDVDKYGPNEKQINAANFDLEVVQAKGVVLVDAYAPWCPHCQKISTAIKKISDDYAGRVKVGKMNANNQDEATKANFDFAVSKGLQGYPTVWIYKDGTLVDSFSGEKTYCEIKAILDKQLN